MSGFNIFGIIIGVGCVILLLTGLGILTTAIFEISQYKKQGITPETQKALDKIKEEDVKETMTKLLTTNIPEPGVYIIDLSGTSLVVSKITIITIWILIIVGLFGAKFIM
jgi:hypothetical protein